MPSPLQIRPNYRNAVKSLGGTVVFDEDQHITAKVLTKAGKEVWRSRKSVAFIPAASALGPRGASRQHSTVPVPWTPRKPPCKSTSLAPAHPE
jgi:hypothetical protein